MNKGTEIKASKPLGGIQSTLERKLRSAEPRPLISSRLPPVTFKDVWMFAAGHWTAHELPFTLEKHSAQ